MDSDAKVSVEKVKNLSEDFIMGMDISSIVSELKSGVTFKDYGGRTIDNVADFCGLLAQAGVTMIRVRVWNDPYDIEGRGYGGGNSDIPTAKIIADACRKAGLKMLVDFHCSDFWADPEKQYPPKAWRNFTLDEKASAVKEFIEDALGEIDPSHDVVSMAQIGNETTKKFVGEEGADRMCPLFKAGIEGTKNYDSNVKTVIHVTNLEQDMMSRWADSLMEHGVNFDILATSYYPYWHGTLAHLVDQLSYAKERTGRDVMVAETSYAFTLADTDGHGNTTGQDYTTYPDCTEPFTVQGQATAIRNLIEAVSDAGGIGVFYWEPAWITVGDTTGLSGKDYDARVAANRALWEEHGSGWASSAAVEFEPDDVGTWYGGTAVDNEAMFYPDGSPTAALAVWKAVR